jgi:predicted MFS family arabinose efflux permease
VTFPLLLFAYLFSQFFRSFLTIIAGDLGRDLGFGPEQLGWISSAWFMTFAAAQFMVGYLLDTVGPRRTMGGLMAVGVVGAVLFAVSPGFTISVVAMGMIGLGCSPMLMASLYIFGRTERPERFAILSSAIIGLGTLGVLAASTPLTLAAQQFGWRWSMAAIGIVMGLAAMLILLFLKDPPPAHRKDGTSASILGDILTILRIRALWFAFPLHLVSYGVIATERGLWIGPYLDQVQGLEALARGNVVMAMSLAMGLGALACAPAARLFGGVKTPALIGNAVTVALFLLLGFWTSVPWLGASAILVGIGFFGLTYSLLLSHGRQFFPDHLLGRGVTLLNFLAIGGAGLLQAITGRVMDSQLASGVSPTAAYATIHTGLGLALLALLIVFLRAPAKPKV